MINPQNKIESDLALTRNQPTNYQPTSNTGGQTQELRRTP